MSAALPLPVAVVAIAAASAVAGQARQDFAAVETRYEAVDP